MNNFTFMHWGRKWQPTPVFLPGESQGQGSWWAAIYGVAQSRTQLMRLSSSSIFIGHTRASLCLCHYSGGKDSYASGPSTVLSIGFSNKIFCLLCSTGMWGPSSPSSDSFPLPHCVESPVSCGPYILSCFTLFI